MTEKTNRVQELIKKYDLYISSDGKIRGDRPNSKDAEELREMKVELAEELKRQREAEVEAMMAEAKAKENKEQDIIDGKIKITVRYQDGEYLSGYAVNGMEAAQALIKIGFAKDIQGWGYLVKGEAVKALGEEFTYQQAAEYMRPANEAKEARRAAKEAERVAKFEEAKTTGKPVILSQWSEDCNDPGEDCDIDNLTEYAMPDGRSKIERHHTW